MQVPEADQILKAVISEVVTTVQGQVAQILEVLQGRHACSGEFPTA